MALQRCRECGTEFPTHAEHCPTCGCPSPSEPARGYLGNRPAVVFFLVVLLGTLVVALIVF